MNLIQFLMVLFILIVIFGSALYRNYSVFWLSDLVHVEDFLYHDLPGCFFVSSRCRHCSIFSNCSVSCFLVLYSLFLWFHYLYTLFSHFYFYFSISLILLNNID